MCVGVCEREREGEEFMVRERVSTANERRKNTFGGANMLYSKQAVQKTIENIILAPKKVTDTVDNEG